MVVLLCLALALIAEARIHTTTLSDFTIVRKRSSEFKTVDEFARKNHPELNQATWVQILSKAVNGIQYTLTYEVGADVYSVMVSKPRGS